MRETIAKAIFLILFFSAITGVYASKVKLETEHGKNLDKASFVVRYKFEKTTGIDWKASTRAQRKKFLEHWYDDLEREHKQALERKKKETEEERKVREEKRDEQRALQEKLRQKRELAKKHKEEEDARQKEFDDEVKQRKQEIKDLHMKDEERKHK